MIFSNFFLKLFTKTKNILLKFIYSLKRNILKTKNIAPYEYKENIETSNSPNVINTNISKETLKLSALLSYYATMDFPPPQIQCASIISISPTAENNTSNLLKIALYCSDSLIISSDYDFGILINNVLLATVKTEIITFTGNKHFLQLTCDIPKIFNSTNIYVLLGTLKNEYQLETLGTHLKTIDPIFPYIIGENLRVCSFKWLQCKLPIKLNENFFILNTLNYKLSTSIDKLKFKKDFSNSNDIINNYHSFKVEPNDVYVLTIHITNNTPPNLKSSLGDIVIKFKSNFSIIDLKNLLSIPIDIRVILLENSTLLSFNLLINLDFWNKIHVIHIYYEPAEYLLLTSDGKKFINSSHKIIATKPEITENL